MQKHRERWKKNQNDMTKLGGEDKGQIKATINEAIIDTRSP